MYVRSSFRRRASPTKVTGLVRLYYVVLTLMSPLRATRKCSITVEVTRHHILLDHKRKEQSGRNMYGPSPILDDQAACGRRSQVRQGGRRRCMNVRLT